MQGTCSTTWRIASSTAERLRLSTLRCRCSGVVVVLGALWGGGGPWGFVGWWWSLAVCRVVVTFGGL